VGTRACKFMKDRDVPVLRHRSVTELCNYASIGTARVVKQPTYKVSLWSVEENVTCYISSAYILLYPVPTTAVALWRPRSGHLGYKNTMKVLPVRGGYVRRM
jgi:hypothetical protein